MAQPGPLSKYRLLTPSDVQELLCVSRNWVYKAAKEGRLPAIRLGGPDGPVRFVEEDLIAHLEAARAAWQPGKSSWQTLGEAGDNR